MIELIKYKNDRVVVIESKAKNFEALFWGDLLLCVEKGDDFFPYP